MGSPIDQLGYVVPDIGAAMERWLGQLDVGPFFHLPRPPLGGLRYRGRPTDAAIAVALTYAGDLQVELIQPLDDHPSPYRDFALAQGSGLHHVARFAPDFDAAVAARAAAGRDPVYEGHGLTPDQRFAYFEAGSNGEGTVEEVVELAGVGGFFEHIRSACAAWDGTAPVRVIEL